MLRLLAEQVMEVYRRLDTAVAQFAGRTGLACPDGCGECCRSEKVEATILECLPLAFELFRAGRADSVLERLAAGGGSRQCILYRPDLTAAGLWGCSEYCHRAVVCRLFGFAGNRDREGLPRLALCRVMKNKDGAAVAVSAADLALMPLFSEAGLAITALHPGLGTRRLPINEALLQAVQKVGMFVSLCEWPTGQDDCDERAGQR